MRAIATLAAVLSFSFGLAGCGEGSSNDAAADCVSSGVSELGIKIEFPKQACTFSLAQAAAGIDLAYQVVVENDVSEMVPTGQSSCPAPGPSGLYVFERVSGAGQSYCICDTGLCPAPPSTPVVIAQGTTSGTFSWDGTNWNGPSDTGNPKGPAFPPGKYTVVVSAKGSHAGNPYDIHGDFGITLTP